MSWKWSIYLRNFIGFQVLSQNLKLMKNHFFKRIFKLLLIIEQKLALNGGY